VNVLVGNTSALDGLTDEQRGWLDAAAADTQQWAIDNLPSDADAAAAWCTAGGSMVAASPEQLAAFAAAVEPVRESLAADPLTAEAIAQIEMLKAASTPADAVVAC
jgi:TRAP-type C4-dicarboxylate transport system substrate-binding protein